MKTSEELKALKEEVETLNAKLQELTEDELNQVNGGVKTASCNLEYFQKNYNDCPFKGSILLTCNICEDMSIANAQHPRWTLNTIGTVSNDT